MTGLILVARRRVGRTWKICSKILCGDLMEEVFDESSFPLSSELDDFNRKGKSHAKSCLNKTCKIKRVKFSKKGAK
jgi:hypothetical protein